MTIIQAKGVTKEFGELTAVDSVSISIERGELVGIIGPDGAGKTTFLRMLAGSLDPTSGSITVNEKTFKKNRQELKAEIGYLSQVSQAYGDLTVWENLEFFGKIRKIRDWEKRGEELLRFARLNDFKDRLADQLSGGMRQKLGVCCAVIHQPQILILDEPTTGVDPVSRRELWMILSTFLKNSMTILVATPYLTEAERCSRVALFNEGKLLRYDTAEVMTASTSLHVFEIVTRNLKAAFEIVSKSRIAENVIVLGDRIDFVTKRQLEDGPKSILDQVRVDVDPNASMRETSPTLDNVFASLIKS